MLEESLRKKVTSLIDKAVLLEGDKNKEYSKKIIINELSGDKNLLISFLETSDEFYFLYVLEFLDEVILKVYSKAFVKRFKESIYKRYDKLLNINIYSNENASISYND